MPSSLTMKASGAFLPDLKPIISTHLFETILSLSKLRSSLIIVSKQVELFTYTVRKLTLEKSSNLGRIMD